jgi:hypothetical protein
MVMVLSQAVPFQALQLFLIISQLSHIYLAGTLCSQDGQEHQVSTLL